MAWALGTFDAGSGPFPGVVVEESRVLDAGSIAPDVRALFDTWGASLGRLQELAAQTGGVPVDDLRILPPLEPRQVFQAGANYYQHVLDLIVAEERARGVDAETALEGARRIMDERVASGEPYVFLGAVGAICGARDDVVLHDRGAEHDWELELAGVFGPDGELAAFTITNDISTRDLIYRPDLAAIGTDWARSKNAPTFLPVGPWIVPACFVDPGGVRLVMRLNGTTMQDESSADMIFDTERLRAYVVERHRVFPGDLLLTGSPAGNGAHWGRFLAEGDVMECEITGLGRQRNRCVTQ
jgi:2-keto-4-pentenoate hydratase/2-oxohepta-3-ene-1,7-dioic acid hydratase in catechol pathway